MNNELLLLNKKHTHTLIEQTKSKSQEPLDFKMNKQMRPFSSSPQMKLVEEGKWLLGLTRYECINSVFNIRNENNSFSITIPSHWIPEKAQQTIEGLKELLDIDKRDLSLNIAAVREKGHKIYIRRDEYDLDNSLLRNEIVEKLKK